MPTTIPTLLPESTSCRASVRIDWGMRSLKGFAVVVVVSARLVVDVDSGKVTVDVVEVVEDVQDARRAAPMTAVSGRAWARGGGRDRSDWSTRSRLPRSAWMRAAERPPSHE